MRRGLADDAQAEALVEAPRGIHLQHLEPQRHALRAGFGRQIADDGRAQSKPLKLGGDLNPAQIDLITAALDLKQAGVAVSHPDDLQLLWEESLPKKDVLHP